MCPSARTYLLVECTSKSTCLSYASVEVDINKRLQNVCVLLLHCGLLFY